MNNPFTCKYSVMYYFNGYIIKREIPGQRPLYLKSIYRKQCVWYGAPLWGKTYETEQSAYKVITKILMGDITP